MKQRRPAPTFSKDNSVSRNGEVNTTRQPRQPAAAVERGRARLAGSAKARLPTSQSRSPTADAAAAQPGDYSLNDTARGSKYRVKVRISARPCKSLSFAASLFNISYAYALRRKAEVSIVVSSD